MDSDRPADEILRKMASVRSELSHDVDEIVENARTLTDWHHYARAHSWACLAASMAVGYLMVPGRSSAGTVNSDTLARLIHDGQVKVNGGGAAPQSGGLIRNGIGVLAMVALRHLADAAFQRFGVSTANSQDTSSGSGHTRSTGTVEGDVPHIADSESHL